MKQFREYFIGGPLDGYDKTEMFPGVHFGVHYDETWTYADYEQDPSMNPDLIGEVKTHWLYTPQRFVFGGIAIQFWSDHRYMSREVISLRLAELIMAPHEKTVPQEANETRERENA